MGTSDQDTFFIDLTSKAITTGGYEEGLPSSRSMVIEGEGGPVGSNSTGSRKRRRSGSDIVDSYDSSLKKVNKILGHLSDSLAPAPSSIATYEDPNVSKTLAITKTIGQVMGLLDAARDRLYKAKERPEDDLFLKIAQNEYDRVLKHYSAMVASLNAAPGNEQASNAGAGAS